MDIYDTVHMLETHLMYSFQLLEHEQFQDNIIKIKTIGSTYMAASGLNPSRIVRVSLH